MLSTLIGCNLFSVFSMMNNELKFKSDVFLEVTELASFIEIQTNWP